MRKPALLIGALLATLSCLAQSTTGTITGTVTDPGRAVVTGAQITLTNSLTGLVKTVVTNSTGQYVLDFIPVGIYTIRIEDPGFTPQQRGRIEIAAAQGIQINFSLHVQSVTQSVSVSSEAPLISVGTSDLRTQISSTQLNELPVSHQDWTSLLQTTPGIAQSDAGSAGSEDGSGIDINGLPGTGYNLTVDGTNAAQDMEHPAFGFSEAPNIINTVNNDAIQEVSMVRGIAPASVSGTMAGNINIITKGGTNAFHGDVYEINEENLYDARNQFETSRPRTTFNQFGGAISGPILPNKMFFFTSYEGVRYNAFTDVSDDVPTPYLISISPSVFASEFAAYPAVPQPADQPQAYTVNLHKTGSTVQNDSNGIVRLDYNQSGNNQYTVRYTRGRPYYNDPNIIVINPRIYQDHGDAYNASWIHSQGQWVSNARFGYNRLRSSRDDVGIAQDFEGVSFSGFSTGGSELFLKAGDIWTGEESIAWTHGHHTIQTGGIIQKWNAGRTDLNTTDVSYSSLSDFQSNIPSKIRITFDLAPFNIYEYQFGGYIQDDYRILPNLTINAGIRYDYFTVPKEDSGRLFNRGINPAAPQLGPGFGPYLPADSIYNANHFNIQPRLGFSWGFGPSGYRAVVRGGFGVYTNPHEIYGEAINEVQTNAQTPFRITLNREQALAAGLQYPVPRADYTTILQNLQTQGVFSSDFADSAIKQSYPNPYSMQYTLGISQAFPWDSVLDIAYVGNRGLHENITDVENLPDRISGTAPFPQFSQFNYYYAGDTSNYNGLQVQLTKRLSQGITFGAAYVWSKSMAFEYAGLLKESSPQDNNNIKADYGPTPYDIRNHFVLNGVWTLPLQQWFGLTSRPAGYFLGGWRLSGVFTATDGNPNNIGDGNSSYPSDRPDPVPGVNPYVGHYNLGQLQYLNPLAFVNPAIEENSGAQIRGGYLSKDSIYGPGEINLDATLSKSFRFTEHAQFELHMDSFNALNHTNLGGLETDTTSGSFGQLTSATARTVQIGGKFTY
ncbi:TonB-dependent receptor [Paracidobacterium acidisoli]|uniref:TonB-dependent receptor n=1 Tax=Paracidobacterium acidisoli TaxID=2303751 RepID=UPI001C03642F|nr:TonB-dependent receptor [Paracidobacterium acidisoli]MBT9332340.1 TonB-dependent receptor [Paracidobacterium acidisoli]